MILRSMGCIILISLLLAVAHAGCVKDAGVTQTWAAAACKDQKTRQSCASIPGYCHWEAGRGGTATGPPMMTMMPGKQELPRWWGKGLVVGQKVFANYYGHGYFYPATVTSASKSNMIGVKFADSDQDVVDRDNVMVLPAMTSGQMIWAREQTQQTWKMAKVLSSKAGKYEVQFYMPEGESDDQELMADINAVRPVMTYSRGDRVWCDYEGQDRWYRGTVTRAYTNMWYDIKLDNGMSSWQTRGSLMYLMIKADFMDVTDVVRGTVDELLKDERSYTDGEIMSLKKMIAATQATVNSFQSNVKTELGKHGVLVKIKGLTGAPTGPPSVSPTLFMKCRILDLTGGPWPGRYHIQQPQIHWVGPMKSRDRNGARDLWYNTDDKKITLQYNKDIGPGWLLTNKVKTYLTKSSDFRPPASATWHEFLGTARATIKAKCGESASPSVKPTKEPTGSPNLEKCIGLKVTQPNAKDKRMKGPFILVREKAMHNKHEKWSRTMRIDGQKVKLSVYFGEGKLGDFWVYAMGPYKILVTHASKRFRPPFDAMWGPLAGEHELFTQKIGLKCVATPPPSKAPTGEPTIPPTKSPVVPRFDLKFERCQSGGDVRNGATTAQCRNKYRSYTTTSSKIQNLIRNIEVYQGMQKFKFPAKTKCKMELWGAQGGDVRNHGHGMAHGGKGGYATGTYTFNAGDQAYFIVGQKGAAHNQGAHGYGGFGGGGYGHDSTPQDNAGGAGGGGASDIRVGGTTFNHRIIVAGGGGGSRQENGGSGPKPGGVGGGLNGGRGGIADGNQYCNGGGQSDKGTNEAQSGGTRGRACNSRTMCPAYKSNLRSGWPGSYEVRANGGSCCISRFGIGASSHQNDAGGGGGGWWGGGAPGDNCGGCGGSSHGTSAVKSFSTSSGQRNGDGLITLKCGI